MRALIFGKGGQLSWELERTRPADVGCEVVGSRDCDVRDKDAVHDIVERLKPDVLINAAAYTAVDQAEQEKEQAFAVNAAGAAHLASAARKCNAVMVHVSTDFVFDGRQSSPYKTTDPPCPLGVYGASKLEGERLVLAALGKNGLIIRTSWLYSSHGHNFVKTMLRLMAERDELKIVADQVGSPTWARGLAQVIWQLVVRSLSGIYHWSDAGVASWYDFACAIYEEAVALGILTGKVTLFPVHTRDYPTPARRPPYSVLDKTGTWRDLACSPLHWRVNLRAMLKECLR